MSSAELLSTSQRVAAFYPQGVGTSGTVDFPDDLVSKEQPPPPNPLLKLEYEQMGAAGAMRAEPAAVHMHLGQETTEQLHQQLRLINASSTPQRVHILHPETPYFSMAIGTQGEGKRGTIMPGLAEEITVRCNPTDGIRYYRDNIKVHMPDGVTMLIPIHAYPALSDAALPSRIDFGKVAQGQRTERVLPLRSSSEVEFEFSVKILNRHADFTVEPLSGLVPAMGEAAILLTFTPSRMATARAVIEVHVAQLGFKPHQITLVGSSSAHQVRTATLARLYASGAHLPGSIGGSAYSSQPSDAYGDAAAGGALDGGGEGYGVSDPATDATEPIMLASVLDEEPPTELVQAVAAQPLGGGSGGGDAVTRAQALQLRQSIGGASVPVKLPDEIPPFEETQMDGLRVPADLSSQHPVNTMLTQQRNKMRISDLRAAIERQQVAAEKQQEEIEAASMANLSVTEQLAASFTSRVHAIIKHLQDTDVTGSGFVTRAAFQAPGVRKLLKVKRATEADLGALFDTIDTHMEGKVGYSQLERVARRSTKRGAAATEQRMEPGELDQALHGPDRSRQLKELIFSREVAAIEDYEKQKEVKSFVATGQPIIEPHIVDATLSARAEHADEKGRSERRELNARTETERLPDRVLVSESVVADAAEATPAFDTYVNETWAKREGVLSEFQQGVRVSTIRMRVDTRIKAVQASLRRAGISLTDKQAVRSLVVSRAKGGAGVPPPTADASSASPTPGGAGPRHGLTKSMMRPFEFPVPPEKKAQPREDPIQVTPIEPFDDTKIFALRVRRRYVQMGYKPLPLTAPGAFPPLEANRELRVGAAFESGRPLPTGFGDPIPSTWGLPPLLLQAPPQPLTPGAMEAATMEATKDISAGAPAPGEAEAAGGEEPVELEGAPAAPGGEDALAVLPKLAPRVMSQPPPSVEMDCRQMLRPMPIACNQSWRFEPIGWGSAVVCLGEPTLASKWRAMHEPWSDALVELPAEMSGVVQSDVAEQLSEDESDTEIDPSLRFPPSLSKLSEVFDLPAAAPAPAPADAAAAEEASAPAAAPATVTAAAAAAAAVDEGDVPIAPERSLPVDELSECARAGAALGEAASVARREQRLRLRERFAMLNELIDKPRYQLSLT